MGTFSFGEITFSAIHHYEPLVPGGFCEMLPDSCQAVAWSSNINRAFTVYIFCEIASPCAQHGVDNIHRARPVRLPAVQGMVLFIPKAPEVR